MTVICNAPLASPPVLAPPPADEDSIVCKGLLVARTLPEEMRSGEVTICSVWWIPHLTGGLARVYPMPLRGHLTAWQRYELELTKSKRDSRWRSYKLANGSLPESVDDAPKGARKRLRDDLAHLASGTTIQKLNEKRDSLGMISPRDLKPYYRRCAPDQDKVFGRKTFGLRPYLRFRDADGAHDLGLNEWGCYEWLRKRNDPAKLWDNLGLTDPGREVFLLVGNMRDHPGTWLIIAVLTYELVQPRLF